MTCAAMTLHFFIFVPESSHGDYYDRRGHSSRRDDQDYRYHRDSRRSSSPRRYYERSRYNDSETDHYDSRSEYRSRSREKTVDDSSKNSRGTVSADTESINKNHTLPTSQPPVNTADPTTDPTADLTTQNTAPVDPTADLATQKTAPAPMSSATGVATSSTPGEQPLELEVLKIIGDRLNPDRVLLPAIHKDLAVRVEEIINKGLPTTEKKTLLQKFPPPENGLFMDPPKLNFEIKTNIPDSIVKRDDRIVEKQARISASLAGITKLMSMTLQLPQDQKLAMLEILGGVSRILADLQHEESEIRRSLILKNIDPSKRDILKSTSSNEWLFGGSLDEKFKAARLLESTAKKIKPAAQTGSNNESKNLKGPSRRPSYKSYNNSTTSGQKSTSSQKTYRSHKQPKKSYPQSKK
ncbi:Protein of unknown function [Cotesia congregata]|uniref:Uncharacterized protein n=1 Tax=Cotesia congregata TaxID=51543 RepID=A0A8J2HGX4_COTCN|nr:Protein of unknown function [Cotesia congregata]